MKKFKDLIRETENSVNQSPAARTLKEKPNKETMAKLKEENDTTEKVEMVQSQLHFIKYACEEILEYIDAGGKVEEWYQVKIAKSFSEFESLHSFIEGESRRTGMKEEVEQIDELSKGLMTRALAKEEKEQGASKKKETKFHQKLDKLVHSTFGKSPTEMKKEEGKNEQIKDGDPCWKDYEMIGMKMKNGKKVPNCVPEVKEEVETPPIHVRSMYTKQYAKHGGTLSKAKEASAKAYDAVEKMHGKEMRNKLQAFHSKNMNEEEKPPFEGGTIKPKQKVIPGKFGVGYSTARHLARQAMKKQIEKNKNVKEAYGESRKVQIVKEIVKNKKKQKNNSEKFESDPVLTSQLSKT